MKIFKKNLNNNPNILSLKPYTGETIGKHKYLPAFSKEWKSIIYSYDKKKLTNINSNNSNINKAIKSYFDLYFKNHQFLGTNNQKFILLKRRRNFMRRIYTSTPEIKYTNNKVIISIYTLNREKKILRKKLKTLLRKIKRYMLRLYLPFYRKTILNLISILKGKNKYLLWKNIIGKKHFIHSKMNYFYSFIKLKNLYSEKFWTLFVKNYFKSSISHIKKKKLNKNNPFDVMRKYELLYSLNQYKYNKLAFLPNLTYLLTKGFDEELLTNAGVHKKVELQGLLAGKKLEYNIINLKSVAYNTDIFTKALTFKLRKKKIFLRRAMKQIIDKAQMPDEEYTFKKRIHVKRKRKNIDPFFNKHRDLKVLSNLVNVPFSKLISKIHTANNYVFSKNGRNFDKLNSTYKDSIFNSIKYKNLRGIKLEINGRLTRRYRADRSIHKKIWKGGLKNFDASFERLSSVLFRGNTNSNISYSLSKSQRRIGAFAIKGWIGGK